MLFIPQKSLSKLFPRPTWNKHISTAKEVSLLHLDSKILILYTLPYLSHLTIFGILLSSLIRWGFPFNTKSSRFQSEKSKLIILSAKFSTLALNTDIFILKFIFKWFPFYHSRFNQFLFFQPCCEHKKGSSKWKQVKICISSPRYKDDFFAVFEQLNLLFNWN